MKIIRSKLNWLFGHFDGNHGLRNSVDSRGLSYRFNKHSSSPVQKTLRLTNAFCEQKYVVSLCHIALSGCVNFIPRKRHDETTGRDALGN